MHIDPTLKSLQEVRCPFCSYLLMGLPEARCPECGSVFDQQELTAALAVLPQASPWDDKSNGLLGAFTSTAFRILLTPRRFVREFPTFYDPNRAVSFWWFCAIIAGCFYLLRTLSFLAQSKVPFDRAFIAGLGASTLLLLGA